MQLTCYQCPSQTLKPTMLVAGLPALCCGQCQGTHLGLLSYRAWRDAISPHIKPTKSTEHGEHEVQSEQLSNTTTALICQRCQRLMIKYRISHGYDNHIDVCHTCDEVWLDGGEWQLLHSLDVTDRLTEVMGEPWQKNIRQQAQNQAQEAQYRHRLGEADFERVNDFSRWLAEHPEREVIWQYLSCRP